MKPRALFLVLILMAVSTGIMWFGPYLELSSRLAPDKPLDEAPVVSPNDAALLFERLGEEGRGLYRQHFWWDLCFLLANAGALAIVLSVALPRAGAPRRLSSALLLLPMAAALADFAENVAIVQLLARWEAPPGPWVTVAQIATTAKMFVMGGAVVSALASLSIWALRFVYKTARPQTGQVQGA